MDDDDSSFSDPSSDRTSSDGVRSFSIEYEKPCLARNRFFTSSYSSLFTIPIISLLLVAALDQADKQLLASSFPMLERTLGLNVQTLGYFSLFSNLSYALAMPLWSWALHTVGMEKVHELLSFACILWGTSTVGIALFGSSIYLQALFRCINGGALASILPLSQAILAELVHSSMRGRAFGLMSVCEKIAGTLAASSVIYFHNWQYPYIVIGLFSILMAAVSQKYLNLNDSSGGVKHHGYKVVNHDDHNNDNSDGGNNQQSATNATDNNITSTEKKMTMKQIIHRIIKFPAFICLVAQGVFGGIPWDMMSFVLLLLDWRGFTKEQIVTIQFTFGISGTIGSWLGGSLGDYFAIHYPIRGRVYVAFASVVMSIPIYGLLLYSTSFASAIFGTIYFI